MYLAVEQIPTSATETIELLNSAQQGLQEVKENPGIISAWLEDLLPDVLGFAVQVVVAFVVYLIANRLIHLVLKIVRRSMEKANVDEGVKQFVLPVIKYALYFILIFIIMGLFGIATTSAVAVLGSAGVAVGLALQGSLSNFAGGVLILILKPFKVGDYIVEHSHGNEGTVTEISIFYTTLTTADNRIIVIPNGSLSNSSLTNVSRLDKRRIDLVVGIGYEADIKAAKDVFYSVAEQESARLPEEEILVYVDNLGTSSVDLGLRIWVNAADYWAAKWRLTENIKLALDEHEISIPYQQIDVQIKQ